MSENRTFDLTQTPPVEEPARQYYYMEKLRGLVADQSRDLGRPLTAAVVTFGCQMNARDSEKLRGILREVGYIRRAVRRSADFVIYNTCYRPGECRTTRCTGDWDRPRIPEAESSLR